MKHGNWVPIDARLAKFLPKDRAYSEVEAAYCLQLNYDKESPVTVAGLASAWGWTRKRTARFLKDSGIEIIYPKGMGSRWGKMEIKEPEGVQVGIQVRDRFGTGSGQVRIINNKHLEDERDRFGTGSGQVRDRLRPTINHTTYPNPENNNIADSVPESANITIEDENEKNTGNDSKRKFDANAQREDKGEKVGKNGSQTLLPGIGEQGDGSAMESKGKTINDDGIGDQGTPGDGDGTKHELPRVEKYDPKNDDGSSKNRVAKPFTLSEVRQMRLSWWSEEEWEDLIDLRRKKKAAQTKRAYNQLINEFEKAKERGYTADEIMNAMNSGKGWSGFKLDWMKDPPRSRNGVNGKKIPAKSKEEMKKEIYEKYGNPLLRETSSGEHKENASAGNNAGGYVPAGNALQVLFGKTI